MLVFFEIKRKMNKNCTPVRTEYSRLGQVSVNSTTYRRQQNHRSISRLSQMAAECSVVVAVQESKIPDVLNGQYICSSRTKKRKKTVGLQPLILKCISKLPSLWRFWLSTRLGCIYLLWSAEGSGD